MRFVQLPTTSYSAANYVFINQLARSLPAVPLHFPLHRQPGAGEHLPGTLPPRGEPPAPKLFRSLLRIYFVLVGEKWKRCSSSCPGTQHPQLQLLRREVRRWGRANILLQIWKKNYHTKEGNKFFPTFKSKGFAL